MLLPSARFQNGAFLTFVCTLQGTASPSGQSTVVFSRFVFKFSRQLQLQSGRSILCPQRCTRTSSAKCRQARDLRGCGYSMECYYKLLEPLTDSADGRKQDMKHITSAWNDARMSKLCPTVTSLCNRPHAASIIAHAYRRSLPNSRYLLQFCITKHAHGKKTTVNVNKVNNLLYAR